jgi:hypothetical protein
MTCGDVFPVNKVLVVVEVYTVYDCVVIVGG